MEYYNCKSCGEDKTFNEMVKQSASKRGCTLQCKACKNARYKDDKVSQTSHVLCERKLHDLELKYQLKLNKILEENKKEHDDINDEYKQKFERLKLSSEIERQCYISDISNLRMIINDNKINILNNKISTLSIKSVKDLIGNYEKSEEDISDINRRLDIIQSASYLNGTFIGPHLEYNGSSEESLESNIRN